MNSNAPRPAGLIEKELPLVSETNANDSLKITFAPLSLDEVYQLADDPGNGAIVVMSGTVRDKTKGQKVTHLEYQAYEPMAIAVFKAIAQKIRQQWQDTNRVVIHHRIGKLEIGEISVLVAVGCPHRGEAFAACRYAIDTLKHNAPIWKKEYNIILDDNTGQETVVGTWVKLSECC